MYLTRWQLRPDIEFIAWEVNERHTPTEHDIFTKGTVRKHRPNHELNSSANNSHWGNKMGKKSEDCVQICMENVNVIKPQKSHNIKLDHGKVWLLKNNIYIACWIETGVPWHKQRRKNKLQQLMKAPLWESQINITSNNVDKDPGLRQFRGTATMEFNRLTSAIAGTGYDVSGLAQWSWVKFQGRHNKMAMVITAYNPCKSTLDRL